MIQLAFSSDFRKHDSSSNRRHQFSRFGRRGSRHGLTLVELMVAVALTLVIITAMIRAFKTTSQSISLGRAKMDMHNELRLVSEQLRRDLQNATRSPNPLDTADGYMEIVEGDETDGDHATTTTSFIGDHDDILAMTVRSTGEPFRGRFSGVFVESYVAEVIWWIQHTGTDDYGGQYRLYRRVLLIRPDLTTTATNIVSYYDNNDVSVRPDGAGGLAMNSLADLADRRNRFAHNSNVAAFPHEFITAGAGSLFNRALTGIYEGEDLMLDNCVAFDIKVFDPTAQVFRPDAALITANPLTATGQVIDFDDPGFDDPSNANDVVGNLTPSANPGSYAQVGAYVNLGYDRTDFTTTPTRPLFTEDRWFSDDPYTNNYSFTSPTYCTWSEIYESDGLDQDGDGVVDEGSDGVDNDSTAGIDDNEERETRPPYVYPIRSLQVSIRLIERNTNQVLQRSVREHFVPN